MDSNLITEYAGVAYTEYKDKNGFKRTITARASSVQEADRQLGVALDGVLASGGTPYERPSFGPRAPKPQRSIEAGCAECGAPVTEETKMEWNGKSFWKRDCTSGNRHKTGFFRPAA